MATRPSISFNTSGAAFNLPRTTTTQNQQWVNTTTQPITTNYTTTNIVSGKPIQFNTVQGQAYRTDGYAGNFGTTIPYNANNYGYGYTEEIRRQTNVAPVNMNYTSNVAPRVSTQVVTPVPTITYQPTYQPSQSVINSQRVQTVTSIPRRSVNSPPVYFRKPQQKVTTTYVTQQVPVVANQAQWVQQDIQRPQYTKLYNTTTEHYRELAPQNDPVTKKTCCSPCCWILFGLLGLLALLFGILCGLGVLCGGMNLGLPSVTAPSINVPTITTPTITTSNITTPTITTPTITTPTITTNIDDFSIDPVAIAPTVSTNTNYYTTTSTSTTPTVSSSTYVSGTRNTTPVTSTSIDPTSTNYIVTDTISPYVTQPTTTTVKN